MKKHLFGLVVFSFIVGAAIVYRSVFVAAPHLKQNLAQTVTDNLNWKVSDKLYVKRADYDVKEDLLRWELSAPKVDSPVVLHFFIKDENGTRHIASGQGVNTCLIEAKLEFTTYFSGLDNLKSYENLYVIAEFGTKAKVYKEGYKPIFDSDKATPILPFIHNRPPAVTE